MLGAYRTVTIDAARKRKDAGLKPGQNPMPQAWFEEWAQATKTAIGSSEAWLQEFECEFIH